VAETRVCVGVWAAEAELTAEAELVAKVELVAEVELT
jgi:hypothetical protein